MTALNKRISYEEEYTDMNNYYIAPKENKMQLLQLPSQMWEERGHVAAYTRQLETLKTKLAYQVNNSVGGEQLSSLTKSYNRYGFSQSTEREHPASAVVNTCKHSKLALKPLHTPTWLNISSWSTWFRSCLLCQTYFTQLITTMKISYLGYVRFPLNR